MKDPEFLADATKAKLEIEAIDGPTAAKRFARIYELKPALKERLKGIVMTVKQ